MTEQELMLTAILECDRTDLYASRAHLTDSQAMVLWCMQERRLRHEPLQYILGQTDFFGLTLKVDRRVFIPRPETELLIENVLEAALNFYGKEIRVLDVGTGSGNIAITLAKTLTEARVISMDVSRDALKVARQNARLNGISHRIDFVHYDFFKFAQDYREAENHFDIIVSNPPYIPTAALAALPADVQEEPAVALDGGEDGLKFYRALIGQAKCFLKQGGCLACEIGDDQKDALTHYLGEQDFADFYFKNDLCDRPRFFLAHAR